MTENDVAALKAEIAELRRRIEELDARQTERVRLEEGWRK